MLLESTYRGDAWDDPAANYDAVFEENKKKAQKLNLFTRPTLSWKLSCEADPATSRATYYQATLNTVEYPTRIITAAVFAFICVGIEVCACGCGLFAGGDSDDISSKTFARAVATVCSGLFVINIVWMA